jgi:hypothetical protein
MTKFGKIKSDIRLLVMLKHYTNAKNKIDSEIMINFMNIQHYERHCIKYELNLNTHSIAT